MQRPPACQRSRSGQEMHCETRGRNQDPPCAIGGFAASSHSSSKSISEEQLRKARNREDAMAALEFLAQEHHRHLQVFISEHLAKKEVSPRYELPAGVSVEARKAKGKPSAGRFIVWGHGMRITVPFDACASEPCQLPCDRPGAKTCGLDLCAHRLALRARMDADTLKSKQWINKYKDPKASS